MGVFSSAGSSPRVSRLRLAAPASALLPRTRARLICGLSASFLITLAGGALFFWAGPPAPIAQAATTCPISDLPPTPTSPGPLDASSITLNEILTNPGTDWDCNGKADGNDQWIELKNTSGNNESLFGLQLMAQGQATQINSSDSISASGYLVIFSPQILPVHVARGAGALQLLDGSGKVIDTVNYPALGADQSYSRDSSGHWQTTTTPTPGKTNSFTNGSHPTPTPTPTKRSGGGGGGGGGGGSAPTATPTPFSSVIIPTDTPGSIALQNPGANPPDSSEGNNSLGMPSWLKTALLGLIGIALLGVIVWYWRSWSQEPEDDG